MRNGASRLSAELGDAKVLLRIARINRQKDKMVEHITGKVAKPLLWHLWEANDKMASEINHMAQTKNHFEYPSMVALHPDFAEPVGLEFSRHKSWSEVDGRIAASEWTPVSAEIPPTAAAGGNTESVQSVATRAMQESFEFPDDDNDYTEMGAIALSIGDEAAESKDSHLTSRADNFLHGATSWNRALGSRASGRTLASMKVNAPMNEFQRSVFQRILAAVIAPGTSLSIQQMTNAVCEQWNREHMRLIGNGTHIGLGGLLEKGTASSYLALMNNAMFAITSDGPGAGIARHFADDGLNVQQPLLPAQAAPIQYPVFPATLIPVAVSTRAAPATTTVAAQKVKTANVKERSKMGRPKRNPGSLKPFSELSMEAAKNLTWKDLGVYTNYLVGKMPRKREDCLKIVLKKIRERDEK